MKINSNSGILFDLDGTLVNSLKDIAGVVNRVRASEGLELLSEEQTRRHIGKGASNLIAGCFPQYDDEQRRELLGRFNAFYLEKPSFGGELYPGVASGLRRLQSMGVRLAVATNKPTAAAQKTLEFYLPDFKFLEVAGPERVTRKKPHPEHLLEVMARLDLDPRNCCFVGDDPVDAACAEAAGVSFFGATYGFGKVEVEPDRRLYCFEDLLQKLC